MKEKSMTDKKTSKEEPEELSELAKISAEFVKAQVEDALELSDLRREFVESFTGPLDHLENKKDDQATSDGEDG